MNIPVRSSSHAPAPARQQRDEYWQAFYRTSRSRQVPSQFAAFVCGELDQIRHVIDFGCGSGRDAIFFARSGFQTLGIDASEVAVEQCRSVCDELGLRGVDFMRGSCSDLEIDKLVLLRFAGMGVVGPLLVYARFFLHAITEEEEQAFLQFASTVTGVHGGKLAVEFRTVRDRDQTKVTPDHYRRYVDPFGLVARARGQGFELSYFVEGFGYAKHKSDDAHVARCIFDRLHP